MPLAEHGKEPVGRLDVLGQGCGGRPWVSCRARRGARGGDNYRYASSPRGRGLGADLAGADATALASLTAGNVAATEGLAQLIGETEFSTLFHEGHEDSLHISLISDKVILLVIFDEHSSLGLVRLRVKQRSVELEAIVNEMSSRSKVSTAGVPAPTGALAEITDEDINALFG